MKKSVKITLKFFAVVIVFAALVFSLLKFPSAEIDNRIFGDKFVEHISDKYALDLVDIISRVESDEYHKKFPLLELKESQTRHPILAVADYMESTKIKGRYFYCTVPADYYGKEYLVEIKGTKIIGDKYTWEVMECDFTRAVVEHIANGDYGDITKDKSQSYEEFISEVDE